MTTSRPTNKYILNVCIDNGDTIKLEVNSIKLVKDNIMTINKNGIYDEKNADEGIFYPSKRIYEIKYEKIEINELPSDV